MCNFGEHQTGDIFQSRGHLRNGYDTIDSFMYEGLFAEETKANKKDILQILKNAPQSTPQEIANALGVKREWVSRNIAEMIKGGVIGAQTAPNGIPSYQVDRDSDRILKNLPPPVKTEVILRYSYQKRAEAEGPAIIPGSRPFCRKMIELSNTGRVYSRKDIEDISRIVGYSVFERTGGFWNNKGTIEKYCRHYWFTEILLKK